ncbi:hypothetical protein DB88DRAFT_537346, partial [Papiliotrema laurentii]
MQRDTSTEHSQWRQSAPTGPGSQYGHAAEFLNAPGSQGYNGNTGAVSDAPVSQNGQAGQEDRGLVSLVSGMMGPQGQSGYANGTQQSAGPKFGLGSGLAAGGLVGGVGGLLASKLFKHKPHHSAFGHGMGPPPAMGDGIGFGRTEPGHHGQGGLYGPASGFGAPGGGPHGPGGAFGGHGGQVGPHGHHGHHGHHGGYGGFGGPGGHGGPGGGFGGGPGGPGGGG